MVSSSFRDPSGYVFREDGIFYRRVDSSYEYILLEVLSSGLYADLVDSGLMLPFKTIDKNTIKPEQLDFVSYPYEWCFSQLKDAALVTLEIAKRALRHNMVLKDASAYNIQYHKGRPMLIDHLSFDYYKPGAPLVVYKQFCEHFLAPLALMSYKDIRLGQLLRVHLDGIPLSLANRLLPFRANLNFHLFLHLQLHSKSQQHYADRSQKPKVEVKYHSLWGLLDSLESCTRGLNWKPGRTEWNNYYKEEDSYIQDKERLIIDFLQICKPQVLWDLGCNTGLFSSIAGRNAIQVISFDADPACVEAYYQNTKGSNILPLLLDLTNPSPGIGWRNTERMSLRDRENADTILALALIHHLAISNNLPLNRIASFFAEACKTLIIEFVPKSDPKVQKLLTTRKDIFPNYTQEAFEVEFSKFFSLTQIQEIKGSHRTLYLMETR